VTAAPSGDHQPDISSDEEQGQGGGINEAFGERHGGIPSRGVVGKGPYRDKNKIATNIFLI
jgi:hypothetical protein